MKEDYIIICNSHKGLVSEALLFWSEDGGYTNNIRKAEYFSGKSLLEEKIPIYGRDVDNNNYVDVQDFGIRVFELEELDYKQMTVFVR